jgi:penicillin-binding protein 1C
MPVAVQGGQGEQRWWFLNGEPLERDASNKSAALVLDEPGSYQVVVMDEAGQLSSVSFIRG